MEQSLPAQYQKLSLIWIKKMNKRNPSSVFDADIIVDDEYDLSEYGVDGKIVTTPGHTLGSLSIILDKTTAIIGDSLMAFVQNSKPKKPIIAYDLGIVKKSMNELIDMGIEEYYLSHGKSYGVDVIKEAVDRL